MRPTEYYGGDYEECTCGHLYDDHVGTTCAFYGCGCGATDEADR